MYAATISLTMLVLPLASIVVGYLAEPDVSLALLVGKWFVFWGVGARLALAGFWQVANPEFTAENIFHLETVEPLPIIQELGIANLSIAAVALLSIWRLDFVLPAAIGGALFFGAVGLRHLKDKGKSRNRAIAMGSDLLFSVILVAVVLALAAS